MRQQYCTRPENEPKAWMPQKSLRRARPRQSVSEKILLRRNPKKLKNATKSHRVLEHVRAREAMSGDTKVIKFHRTIKHQQIRSVRHERPSHNLSLNPNAEQKTENETTERRHERFQQKKETGRHTRTG